MARQTTKSRPPVAPSPTRYEDDLYTWVQEQVALLRAGRLTEVDARNVAEELSDVGNEQYDKLESAIAVLVLHLLKWDHQTARRSRSWEATIHEQRRRIDRVLRKNPGLKPQLLGALAEGYADGRDRAVAETDMPYQTFPENCPFDWKELMEREIVYVAREKSKPRRTRK